MNKNTIIIVLVVLCLIGSIWGSFQDKQNQVLRTKMSQQDTHPTSLSTIEAKVIRYTCTKTTLATMLREAQEFESIMLDQWSARSKEETPLWVSQELEDIKAIKIFLNTKLGRQ